MFCKDANRPGEAEHTSFDFLGYTFRARLARGRRGFFVSFAPAISAKATKAVGQKVRAWHLNRRSGTDLSGLAEEINPQVRGWIGYYGAFYRSELYSLAWRIDEHLVRWAMQKFKRLRGKAAKARAWLDAVRQHQPGSSPTGTSSRPPAVGLWEPYDGRLSRTVLREPEGEIPSGYSPNTTTSSAGSPRIPGSHSISPRRCSWLNLVEVFFGIITRQAIRRGTFTYVRDLETTIRDFIDGWNERANPFVWTKTADEILDKIKRKSINNTQH